MQEVPVPYLHFPDFLSEHGVDQLLTFVRDREDRLRPSSVTTATENEDPDDIRKSRMLHDFEEVWPLFESTLAGILPVMRKELGIPYFALDRIERQLTVSDDGAFFGPHNDSGGPEVASRMLTYVYYFNMQPKQFEGGDLWLYNSIDEDGVQQQGTDHVTIEPTHNSIIFFPSWAHHEVRPVHTDVEGLAGARITVNGWFHAAPAPENTQLAEQTRIQATTLPTFTDVGFVVRATPTSVHEALLTAYEAGRDRAVSEAPDPLIMINGDPELIPIDDLGNIIAEELRPIHEAWSGQSLEHTATYGIRRYRRGQTLARHCDRLRTHIISAIIHVDNDCEEPWPLVIEDHAGVEHHVVLEPGQMVLYESATCPHARPFPLQGDSYANVFVHFKPTDGWNIDERALIARR